MPKVFFLPYHFLIYIGNLAPLTLIHSLNFRSTLVNRPLFLFLLLDYLFLPAAESYLSLNFY